MQAAVQLKPHPLNELRDWSGFSDMFHNEPDRNGITRACQARSAAMLRGLDIASKTFPANDPERWCRLSGCRADGYPEPI